MLTLTNRIDMRPGAVPLVIHLGQYDSDFSLVFELYSSAGNFTVESGTTAMIRGTKTDGNAYDADATIDISAKTVTVAGSEQMTAAKGRNVYELVLKKGTKVLSTANFILDVERAAMDADTIASESVLKELNAIIAGAETATEAAADAASAADRAEDAADSVSSASTQIATNTADIADLKSDLEAIVPGLSEEAKEALLACFAHVAWADIHGQDYYDALEEALYPSPEPEYKNTVLYKASDGILLSEFDKMEFASGAKSDLTESITGGVLTEQLLGSTTYVMLRLKGYNDIMPTVKKARIKAKVKINYIPSGGDHAGLYLSIKAGTKAAGIYTHKSSNNIMNWTIRNESNNAIQLQEFESGAWYTLELLNENNAQTIKIDDQVIFTGNGNTYLNSSGIVFTGANTSISIEYLQFDWTKEGE